MLHGYILVKDGGRQIGPTTLIHSLAILARHQKTSHFCIRPNSGHEFQSFSPVVMTQG